MSSLILRIALAIIIRIHSETAILSSSIFFSHIKARSGGGGGAEGIAYDL